MFALKLLSNHLSLLLPSEKEANPRKREQALGRLKQAVPKYWERLYKGRNNVELLSNPGFCGKWKVLKELLSHWYNNNDKVLVFSHSVRLLRYLESLFQTTSYTVSFLSGEMPVEERQQEVDDFNSDSNKFVFLISTKAGGVGLNITSANKVVIFDPHWNPSWVSCVRPARFLCQSSGYGRQPGMTNNSNLSRYLHSRKTGPTGPRPSIQNRPAA